MGKFAGFLKRAKKTGSLGKRLLQIIKNHPIKDWKVPPKLKQERELENMKKMLTDNVQVMKNDDQYHKLYRKHFFPKQGIAKPTAAMDFLNDLNKLRQSSHRPG